MAWEAVNAARKGGSRGRKGTPARRAKADRIMTGRRVARRYRAESAVVRAAGGRLTVSGGRIPRMKASGWTANGKPLRGRRDLIRGYNSIRRLVS